MFKTPICGQIPYVDIHDTGLKIKDVWNGNNWNLNMLYTPLPDEIRDRIYSITQWLDEEVPDIWVWKDSITCIYSVKDVYYWLMKEDGYRDNEGGWRWIWRLKASASIQFSFGRFVICPFPPELC